MMCDTNWCTFCDNAINPYSDSLYCSEECLRQDALSHHPMLGYDYADLKNFPHGALSLPKHDNESSQDTVMPTLVRSRNSASIKAIIIPSLSPSLSSSISSYSSCASSSSHEESAVMTASYFHPKPQRIASSVPLIERLNQAIIGL
ncbi:hypothetical protein K501DRAFT_222502 [Backusella circina FSU 941]|nr:hypothetical protein K501DRAFT_222502 [Backusella circina FSU 941]